MAANAKKLMTIRGKYSSSVEYEYRGKTYWVEYANSWTYCISPAKVQHENAQREIDREIDNESKQTTGKPVKPVDLDEIWELMGWD